MKATVNVLCYKSKTLKNGEHPLMICVCKGGKRKYISLGVSVNPIFGTLKRVNLNVIVPCTEAVSKTG